MIVNNTFMFTRGKAAAFVGWLRREGLAALEGRHGASEPSLTRVAAVPGMPDFESQGASYALQFKFQDLESALAWIDDTLPEAVVSLKTRLGEEVMTLSTVLESVQL